MTSGALTKPGGANLGHVSSAEGRVEAAKTGPGAGLGDVAALRQDDFDRDVWSLLGLPVDVADIDQTVAALDSAVRTRDALSFVTLNVNYLVRAMRDRGARDEILNTDLSVLDGAPLVAMARVLGAPAPVRVAGSDLFEVLRRRPGFAAGKVKVFFFGGDGDAARASAQMVNRENGGVEAVGFLNPGHGDVETMSTDAIINEINESDADFVMVALGAAKGQAWIERNRTRLTAPVTAHLGAVVNFTAERIARAPKWVQRLGLEWAWRIKEEPALWRRYGSDALALAKLSALRVAPQLLQRAFQVLGGGENGRGGEPRVDIEKRSAADGEMTVIRLSGAIDRAGLDPVRDAFRRTAARLAAGDTNAVQIDFTDLVSFDRAFLGQLLMLEKHCKRVNVMLSISGVSMAQAAILRAESLDYPQGPPLDDPFTQKARPDANDGAGGDARQGQKRA